MRSSLYTEKLGVPDAVVVQKPMIIGVTSCSSNRFELDSEKELAQADQEY